MFLPIKTFGSTIGLPFLSANEDNQLRFRTGSTGVKRLAAAQAIPESDIQYWQQHQSNIPVPLSIKKTWTGGNTLKNGEDPTREALNCVRVLGRVLVVVYENTEEDVVDDAYGSSSSKAEPTDTQLREHFANTLWKRPLASREKSTSADENSSAAEDRAASLMQKLFNCTIDLLFCAGFTVPESARGQSNDKINLPYNHLLSKSGEDRRTLVKMSLMTLLVALDHWEIEQSRSPIEPPAFGAGSATSAAALPQVNSAEPDTKKTENAFRYFVSKLHRTEDFTFILDGILAIMAEHMSVKNNVLPGSKRPVSYITEVFMLFWKLIDLNKRFRAFLADSGKTSDVVGYVVLACLEMKDNPAQHGLLRMLSYILQTLSSDRTFGPALNEHLRINIPTKWVVSGNASDFLIVSIFSIATTPGLNSLLPALTITLSNIAPYLQGLGVQASAKLLQLFKAFASANFILADEGHPRLVYYLLEAFNGVLSHRLQDNPNLVYAILLHHREFQRLATFTLNYGLGEIQRNMLAKAAAGRVLTYLDAI
ncbi:hypothetical protein QFC20_004513 [Naganishia adeliensis]|uniref:Uncharacterized protein n=1 Tax=Naganishia adeliensis TaxID=92952 RepID=A0ACC2VYG7_9TREE|nr:hypothetical protein QFC20_004513 [Naganishia adeliensis]